VLRTVPGSAPAPVVVAAHGASQGGRSAPLYRHLADRLQRAGVETLLFDRRTTPGPGEIGITPAVLAADLRAWVARLRAHPGLRPDVVALWGHSQGGWLVADVAAADPGVAAVLAVSPSGQPPAEQMAYATANPAARGGLR